MNISAAAKKLGVKATATLKEIDEAFRRFAEKWHPDRRRDDPKAHTQMVEASEARDVLRKAAKAGPSSRCTGSPQHDVDAPRRPQGAKRSTPPVVDVLVERHGWPAPPVTQSEFFRERGFVLRPTEGRVSFRVFEIGIHRYTLLRHPKNANRLYCRDTTGTVTQIDGIGFWLDDGDRVEPLGANSAESTFFRERGFDLVPTEERASFRVYAGGVRQYTLHRHPKNPRILYCRDTTGTVTQIDGVAFWFDDDVRIEPLGSEPEMRRSR